jgi:predicted nucleic acid-binding protein
MGIYVDATTIIALGELGELRLLLAFDGRLSIPPSVSEEVTTEPALNNLSSLFSRGGVSTGKPVRRHHEEENARDNALGLLDEPEQNGDVDVIGGVILHVNRNEEVAVVSDDRRVRTVARGLGATVTGTIGVVVRNVADGELTADEAKALIRRIDSHGLHMTGELRERADELIDEATEETEE